MKNINNIDILDLSIFWEDYKVEQYIEGTIKMNGKKYAIKQTYNFYCDQESAFSHIQKFIKKNAHKLKLKPIDND